MEPRLRIETGRHNGRVMAADISADGTLLLTASDDKTARLWLLPALRPLGVLRPPVGKGPDGNLNAAALRPDGSLAAVAGYTSSGAPPAVHVFDVARRRVVAQFEVAARHGRSVFGLRFAADGALLLLATECDGVIAHETAGWTEVGRDADFAGRAIGFSAEHRGHIAVTAEDGRLRLYAVADMAKRFHPRQAVATCAGRQGERVQFSPDGKSLAVGFEDGGVELRDGATLALHRLLGLDGLLHNPCLNAVAWLPDGAIAAAGHSCLAENRWTVLRWDAAGAGPRREAIDRPLGSNITALAALPGGDLLAITRLGELAVHAADGTLRAAVRPLCADLRADHDSDEPMRTLFRASWDGSLVAWSTAAAWQAQRFDAQTLQRTDATEVAGLAGWSERAAGVQVLGFRRDDAPTLVRADNTRLPLDISGSILNGVDARGMHVLCGSSGYNLLRYRLPEGTLERAVPTPDQAVRVVQSGNGRIAVAALLDGTIRWYRLPDLAELLAVFVTEEDPPRTVAFTPSGYFAASLGAEELIGWQVGHGKGVAEDFFPASDFRDRFHRPDVVKRVVAFGDEAAALRAADEARGGSPSVPAATQRATMLDDARPQITLLVPREGALLPADGAVVLALEVRETAGRPALELPVRVDGGVASAEPLWDKLPLAPPFPGATATLQLLRVRLGPQPREEAVLEVRALDADFNPSAPARVTLMRPPALRAAAGAPKPRLLAVLAGVSLYDDKELRPPVRFAADNADRVARTLAAQRGPLYSEVDSRPLRDPDRAALLAELEWLEEANGDDTVLLFLSGHGHTRRDGTYFFLTREATPERPELGFSSADLRGALGKVQARRLVLLDTCYAGDVNQDGFANWMYSDGVVVFGATIGNRRAVELPEHKAGAFTYALCEILREPERPLGCSQLWPALKRRVLALTDNKQEVAFHPPRGGADLTLLAGKPE